MPSQRQCLLLIGIAAAVLLGLSLYLQRGLGIEPCNLCLLQRAVWQLIGLVAVTGAAHNKALSFYSSALLVLASAGAALALRQWWLPIASVCGPDLQYLWEVESWPVLITQALSGSDQCRPDNWTIGDISLAMWSFGCFFSIACYNAFMLRISQAPSQH